MLTTSIRLALILALAVPCLARDLERPSITAVAFVRIYTNDLAASKKFYSERIQLPEVPCVNKDCTQFQVGNNQYVQIMNANGKNNGMEVVAFQTTDAEGLRRYLASKQIAVPQKLTRNSDGSREFEITDAEGHHVAFLQPSKGSDKRGGTSHRMIHAGFIVKDRAAMDRFYQDVLGFRPYWYGGKDPDHPVWISLQVHDGSDWLEYMLDVKDDADHRTKGIFNHFALGIVDVHTVESSLLKTGWQPSDREKVQMGRDGKYQLNIYDPDDVRVEFMEFAPKEKPCCSEFTSAHPQPD